MTQKKKSSWLRWTVRSVAVIGIASSVTLPILQDRAYQRIVQNGITLPNQFFIAFERPAVTTSYDEVKKRVQNDGLTLPELAIDIAQEHSYFTRPLVIKIFAQKPENLAQATPLLRYEATAHLGLTPRIDFYLDPTQQAHGLLNGVQALEAGRIEGTLTGEFQSFYMENPLVMSAFAPCEPGKCQLWVSPKGSHSYQLQWKNTSRLQLRDFSELFPLVALPGHNALITTSQGDITFNTKAWDRFTVRVESQEYIDGTEPTAENRYQQTFSWTSDETENGTEQNVRFTFTMPETLTEQMIGEKWPIVADWDVTMRTPVVGVLPNLDKLLAIATDHAHVAQSPLDLEKLSETPLHVEVKKGFLTLDQAKINLVGRFHQTFPQHQEEFTLQLVMQYNEALDQFAQSLGLSLTDSFRNVPAEVLPQATPRGLTHQYKLSVKETNRQRSYSINGTTIMEPVGDNSLSDEEVVPPQP